MSVALSTNKHTHFSVHDVWHQAKPLRCQQRHQFSYFDSFKIGQFAEQLRNHLAVFGIHSERSNVFRMLFEDLGWVCRKGGGACGLLGSLEQRFRVVLASLLGGVRRFRAAMQDIDGIEQLPSPVLGPAFPHLGLTRCSAPNTRRNQNDEPSLRDTPL